MKTSIGDVTTLNIKGPWRTKSNGKLRVLQALVPEMMRKFLHHRKGGRYVFGGFDIRGFRIYFITGLAKGVVGGGEFHKVRQEMVFCLTGKVTWLCEDTTGTKKEFMLSPSSSGVWMPPGILHTYEVEKGKVSLLVLANTLFDPDDPRTHDTYPEAQFRKFQAKKKR